LAPATSSLAHILNIKYSDTLSPYASLMVSDKVSH